MKEITLFSVFICIASIAHTQTIEIKLPLKKTKEKEMDVFVPKMEKMNVFQMDNQMKIEIKDSVPLLLQDRLLLRHPSYYMMDPSAIVKDFQEYKRKIETDSFYISPALWAPYTNPRYHNPMLENDLELEYYHGELELVPRYSGKGTTLPENRKSYREQRKLRMLKYITEEVYPTKDSIPQ